MTTAQNTALIFIIAGENSGDLLGANLMRSIDAKAKGSISFAGVGGPEMTASGLNSLFPMEDLAVMGVFEVLPRLPLLLKRINQTAHEVERLKPDVLVTIDAPDFCFRVIKKLKSRGVKIPKVHYVAPSVWAWRPGRAKKIAGFLDHLLCLLPFEPPYFEKEGLPATFVGHPVVETPIADADGEGFRSRHVIAKDVPILMVLPGSRTGEVEKLMGVFGETVSRLAPQFANLQVVIPTVAHVEDRVRELSAHWATDVLVVRGDEKHEAFMAANVALAASGTVALELAMAGLPNVIAYRFNALTGFIAKRLIKTPYANLINIILGREAIPEFIQDNCTAENLSREIARLFDDENAKIAQVAAAQKAMKQLGLGGPPPGQRAAEVVLSLINKETTS
ncbi:MAG: lipid-A-disaccharide synthase [Rhodospirillaceae bacterium]|nr:MAG: lipid-A-disaccharide synthase [Rhodospirillaceae bacterium]